MGLSSEKRAKYSKGTDEQVLVSYLLTLKLFPQVTNIRLVATPLITPLTMVESTACYPSLSSIKDNKDPRRPFYTSIS